MLNILAKMSCILCNKIDEISYKFESTNTLHSKSAIKTFCQEIIGETFDSDEGIEAVICESCFNDINKVDSMEIKINEICNSLRERFKNKNNVDPNFYNVLTGIKQELKEDEQYLQENEQENDDSDTEDNILKYAESEDNASYRISSPEEEIYLKFQDDNKINFSDSKDLIGILQDRGINESDDDEHNVSVLYDMMDENNIEIVVEKKRDKLQCKKCSRIFENQKELKEHNLLHCKNEIPFICEICGKIYRNKSGLDVHVGMHMGIHPFNCMYCKKSFTQKGALIRHIKIHTGEKPYQCEQCGKCFTHHTSFGIHKLSHSGEKSFKCELCGLALISTSHLKRHMRVHTGEKRYSCPTCGRKFAERYNLASHQKVHQNGKSNYQSESKVKYEYDADELENNQMNELPSDA